ncbi:unnamed protein product [Protopolystoma xenopodis]|uniref:Uncharacterized protein n=1 Tax=Protopolystoma xenopodis TaxID=117903 RepID=A0A448WDG2_9PLAT|nr:unnamed protein product [Protopolystoma xenopodis]
MLGETRFGAMLQFEGVVRSRSVTLMMVTLGHRFPVALATR